MHWDTQQNSCRMVALQTLTPSSPFGWAAPLLPSRRRIGPQLGLSPQHAEVAVSPHAFPVGKSHPQPRAGPGR